MGPTTGCREGYRGHVTRATGESISARSVRVACEAGNWETDLTGEHRAGSGRCELRTTSSVVQHATKRATVRASYELRAVRRQLRTASTGRGLQQKTDMVSDYQPSRKSVQAYSHAVEARGWCRVQWQRGSVTSERSGRAMGSEATSLCGEAVS